MVIQTEHYALRMGPKLVEFDVSYPLTEKTVLALLEHLLEQTAAFPTRLYHQQNGTWVALNPTQESLLVLVEDDGTSLEATVRLEETGELILQLWQMWETEQKNAEIARKEREARRDPTASDVGERSRILRERLRVLHQLGERHLTPEQRRVCRWALQGEMDDAEKLAQRHHVSPSTLYRQARDARVTLAYWLLQSLTTQEASQWFAEAGWATRVEEDIRPPEWDDVFGGDDAWDGEERASP